MSTIPNVSLSLLGKKIAFSTIVQYAGELIQIVLSAIMVKQISNFLGEGEFGEYQKILEFGLFLGVIANLGIFGNIVRKMADAPLSGKIFFNSLILRIVSALFFFGIGIISLLLRQSGTIFIVGSLLYGSVLFFDSISTVCKGMLQANYMMGRYTIAAVLGKVIQAGGVIFLTKSGLLHPDIYSSFLFITAALVGTIFTLTISLIFVFKKISCHWILDFYFMKYVLWQGLPFGVINVTNNLYFRFLPDYFASEFLTSSQFASFGISFRAAQVASLFSTFLMFSVLPGFKEYIDGKEWAKARILYRKITWLMIASGSVLVIAGTFLGPLLIEILTHKKYFLPELWFALPCMLLLAAISYGYDLVLITLFAFEKELWLLKREIIAVFLCLVLCGFASFMFTDALDNFGGDRLLLVNSYGYQWPLFLVLLGSIGAESFMVIVGLRKIKEMLTP